MYSCRTAFTHFHIFSCGVSGCPEDLKGFGFLFFMRTLNCMLITLINKIFNLVFYGMTELYI